MLGAFFDAAPSPTCTAAAWTTELASTDANTFIEGTAVVDSAGGVHASTTLGSPNGLRYLYRAPTGGWTLESVPISGFANYNSLTRAPDGTIYVAYRDAHTGELSIRGAWRDSAGTWTPDVIYANGNPIYPSIQADATGRIHCAFGGAGGSGVDQVGYTYRDPPGTWKTAELVDSTPSLNAYNTTIAIDTCGGIHVAYVDMASGTARYAYRDPSTSAWTTEAIATASSSFAFGERAIAVDGTGTVHIGFAGTAGLVYGRRTSGGWTFETADATPGRGCEGALVRDESGAVDIAYKDCTKSGVWLAHRDAAGAWTVTTLDAGAVYLGPAMLAVDSGYGLHALWQSADRNITYGFARICP